MYHGQKDWNVDENLSAVYCSADSFVNYVPELYLDITLNGIELIID